MIAAIDAQPNRGLRAALPTSYATYVERWAIVVGVSKYQDDSINLKYADRDAEALYELLKTPSGGGFAEEHICKLVNEEATTAKITRALRSFLKKPGKDDIVLLYFACHGAPDTDRPDILYLLTHDTDPKDIAGTALPMRELNLSLKENLLAGRVIIIADTCHSAGISNDSTRDIGNNSGAINLYLQEVGAAQKGIALLTSAEANQVSFEDEKWGGGTQMHGFFTYTLVQELRQASEDILQRDLVERVRETVQSRYRQTPLFIGDIDKPLFFAQLNLRNCPEFFTFSQRRCYSAFDDIFLQDLHQKTSKQFTTKFPDFYYSLGLAFLESGNATQALTLLETAVQFSRSNIDEKLFALSLAQLNNQRYKDSSQTFQRYIEAAKVDTSSSLIKELSSAIDHLAKPRALLIGVDTYLDAEKITPIEDAVSDTLALQEALISEFGFQSENVKVLLNQDATYQSILKEFRELVNLAQLSPTFFYFAGKGSIDAQDSPTILAFDSRDKDTPDILLKQLSQIAGQTEVNLTSVIDSSWSASLMSSNSRYVKCDDVSSFSSRAMQDETQRKTKPIDRAINFIF